MAILIKKYRGYEIMYETQMFYVTKDGKNICKDKTKYGRENLAIDRIDREVEAKEHERAEKKKQKEEESIKKNLGKFKCSLNPKEFHKLLTRTNYFNTEAFLKFENGKLSVTQMDPANVVMHHSEISYTGSNKLVKFPVNVSRIKNLLKRIENHKKMLLTIETEENNKLTMKTDRVLISIRLEDLEGSDSKPPDLKFRTKIKIVKKECFSQIKLCKSLAESVWFEVQNKKFSIITEAEGSTFKIGLGKASGKNARSKYSTEYLGRDFFNVNDNLTIQFNSDYPIKISDELGNWIVLAQRVQDE